MKFHVKVLWMSVFLLIGSCATFRKNDLAENQIELTKNNLSLLNGTFKNNESKRSMPLDYLWGSYYKKKEYQSVYQWINEDKLPYYVTLNVLDKNKIKATIKVNDSVLKSFVIKGKVRNGYFEQKRKMYVIPAIILNVFNSSKFRIGLLKDKTVITGFRKIEFGTVYFLSPFNNSESYTTIKHERMYPEHKQ